MISYEKLLAIASKYEEDLTEFRLSGKIMILTDFLEAVIGADQAILIEDFYKALTDNENIKKEVSPTEILLTVDSMTGQDAVTVAESFNRDLDITGVVLSVDGMART